jgi:hypothetical protein
VQLEPNRYAGFLTMGGFLATHATPIRSAPVSRGVFIRQQLLCGIVPEPPPNDPNVNLGKQELDNTAQQTQKQRLEGLVQQGGASCINCHQLMNPLGLALENFNGIGHWRTSENGAAIDASGEILGGTSIDGAFTNHIDMIGRVAGSAEARQCVVKQVFRYAAGRAEGAADGCTLAGIDGLGQASAYDVKQLILGVVASEGFLYKQGS